MEKSLARPTSTDNSDSLRQLLKMQPTFTIVLPADGDEAMRRIRSAIDTPSLHGLAQSAGRCIDYRIAAEDRRFWSPHLSVQVSDGESGSELLGRFSPRPEIWTMFMGIYCVAAVTAFGAVIYGYVQWAMGQTPWALLGVPIGIGVIVVLHIASVIGQNLSADQMTLLRCRLDQTLAVAFPRESHVE